VGALPKTLGEISLWDSVIDTHSPVREIDKLLLENPDLPGFVVTEGSKIVGLLSTKRFLAILSRQFAREVLTKGVVLSLFNFEIVDTEPLIFNADTSIPDACQKAISRPFLNSYEPVIVRDVNGPRVLSVDLLMRIQTELLQETLQHEKSLVLEEQKTSTQLRQAMLQLEETRDRLLRSEENLESQVHLRTEELEKANKNLLSQQKQIQEDLEVARTLQQSILPSSFPENSDYKCHAFMRAARMIGGDFYDAYKISEHQYGFVVGDVSGKGVPAALFMILVKTILQEYASRYLSPAECIDKLNHQLLLRNPLALFVTIIYGILDTKTGIFTFCNGGHAMPYVLRHNERIETLSNKPSPLVGLLDQAKYENISVQLARDDRVLLITDGVTECFSDSNEAFGENRLLSLLKSLTSTAGIEDLIKKIVIELDLFSNGTLASDDITALAIHFLSEPILNNEAISEINLGKFKVLH
jgi:serine phosphatase RsbU (regulator of sigma subunit)